MKVLTKKLYLPPKVRMEMGLPVYDTKLLGFLLTNFVQRLENDFQYINSVSHNTYNTDQCISGYKHYKVVHNYD